jgi:predicted nicotinamide N-methyase
LFRDPNGSDGIQQKNSMDHAAQEERDSAVRPVTREATKEFDPSPIIRSNATAPTIGSSPTARAFFAALDAATNDSSTSKTTSAFIQKRAATLGWRNRHSQSEQYPMTVRKDTTFHVQQVQRGECENTYGTGATVWPASLVLMRYLERHAEALLQGQRVIDLGSGTGITSIAAALLGARHVICTDGEASVVALARRNIAHAAEELKTIERSSTSVPATGNDHPTNSEVVYIGNCPIETQHYWWGTRNAIHSQIMAPEEGFDIVLVSDCVLPKLYPMEPLVEAIDQLLRPHPAGSTAILSYEQRYYPDYDPREKFQDLCHARHLQVTVIPMAEQDPVYSTDDIEIWHVVREGRGKSGTS